MWGYMENVVTYFNSRIYATYGEIFGTIWIASAYKGATDEINQITSIQHHYLNHITWIQVMNNQKDVVNFRGICITGWSRYDHFLALCELLPEAIPSLIFNLRLMQYGELTTKHRELITNELGCNTQLPWQPSDIQYGHQFRNNLHCSFPGHEVYETVISLKPIVENLKEKMKFANKYMTPLHLNFHYLHKSRSMEVIEKLSNNYNDLLVYKNRFEMAASKVYMNDTINEWLMDYLIIPHLEPLYRLLVDIKLGMIKNSWMPRSLPIRMKHFPSLDQIDQLIIKENMNSTKLILS
jgi:hexosaminidase